MVNSLHASIYRPWHSPPSASWKSVEEVATHLEAAYENALACGLSQAAAQACAQAHVRDWQVLECEIQRAKRPVTACIVGA